MVFVHLNEIERTIQLHSLNKTCSMIPLIPQFDNNFWWAGAAVLAILSIIFAVFLTDRKN